jgi:hypothetical protein
MIRAPGEQQPRDLAFATSLLIDLSRLVPVDDQSAPVVELEIVDGGAPERPSIRECTTNGWFLTVTEGRVFLPRSVLELIARVGGGVAEQGSEARDKYGRVPASENALVAERLERSPVLSQAAMLLSAAARRAAARRPLRFVRPWPGTRRWAIAITHDLDVVAFWPIFSALRFAELAAKRQYRRVLQSARAAVAAAFGDPVLDGVTSLLAAEGRHGVRSTWFLLCGTPTLPSFARGDITYRVEEARPQQVVRDILESGGEVALHGSFETILSTSLLTQQRRRLEAAVGTGVTGVRQHFLRMRPGPTQRAMREAGFRYDGTFGFADRNGFRLGVADVVPGWDAAIGRPAGLDLVPLVWMDRSLSKYAGVEDPDMWVQDALELAGEARAVEGLWTGLWHPNLVPALGYPGAPDAFETLLSGLCGKEPHIGTLQELASWRAARRSLRIRHWGHDGRSPDLVRPSDVRVPVEDEDGRLDERLSAPL